MQEERNGLGQKPEPLNSKTPETETVQQMSASSEIKNSMDSPPVPHDNEPTTDVSAAKNGEPEHSTPFWAIPEADYEIVEPPEEESNEDDGFSAILPGPTEEVRYDDDERPRRRGRREARERVGARAAKPAVSRSVGAPKQRHISKRKVVLILIAIAIALLAAFLITLLIILAQHDSPASENGGLREKSASSTEVAYGHVKASNPSIALDIVRHSQPYSSITARRSPRG